MASNAARARDRLGAAEGEATLAQGVTWLALAPRSMATVAKPGP